MRMQGITRNRINVRLISALSRESEIRGPHRSFALRGPKMGDRVYEALESGRFFFDVYLDLLYACLPSITLLTMNAVSQQSKSRHHTARSLTVPSVYAHGVLGRKARSFTWVISRVPPCIDLHNANLTPFIHTRVVARFESYRFNGKKSSCVGIASISHSRVKPAIPLLSRVRVRARLRERPEITCLSA